MTEERVTVTVVLGFEFADGGRAAEFVEAMKDFGIRDPPPYSKLILSYVYLGSPYLWPLESPLPANMLAQRLLAKYKDERESVVLHVYEEAIVADIGDDVNVLNLDGSPYENSPYRIIAMEFRWPESKWVLELANYRDTMSRRMAELGEKMRLANEFGQGSTTIDNLHVAENIKGGSKHAVMDVTIPPEAIAVNRVKIARLRLRPFESYAEATAAVLTTQKTSITSITCDAVEPSAAKTIDYSGTNPTNKWYLEVRDGLQSYDDSGCFSPISLDWEIVVQSPVATTLATVANPVVGQLLHSDQIDRTSDDWRFLVQIRGSAVRMDYSDVTVRFEGTVDKHTHPADIVETAYTSPSVRIFIDGMDKTSVVKPAGPFAADTSDIDLTDAIDWTVGTHTVELRENTTDKLGRIHASGFLQTFIKSK